MNQSLDRRTVAPETDAITTHLPIPGFGVLPVNSFILHAAQPVLVDTGLAATRTAYLQLLEQALDLNDLRWIWLTHTDPDHVGNLEAVLARAPHARLVTTFLGMGKLGLLGIPTDRVYLLNPGESLHAGDRQLLAVRPPLFDAPETTAIFDTKRRTFFSADSFGALMSEPMESADEMDPSALKEGMIAWATVDAPWLHLVDERRYASRVDESRSLSPDTILSSHLPPSKRTMTRLFENLAAGREAPAFVGPNQTMLEKMMGMPAA